MHHSVRRRAAVATAGALMISMVLAGNVLALPVATNDNFASATVISPASLPYTDVVDASAATTEIGEVASVRCGGAIAGIWYDITPNFNGALRADTIGMGAGHLTVYTGAALATLTEIACNSGDATDISDASRVTFKVSAGTTYHVRVSYVDDDSVFNLRRVTRPGNDDFARARVVSSLPMHDHASVKNATYDYAEPDSEPIGTNGCSTADPTIWYTIRTGSNMPLRASVFGAIDTVVAVYRGTSMGTLTAIGCNDDTSVEGRGLASNVAWLAQAGVRYYVQVGGYYGQTGPVEVTIARGNPPANDNFANAETVLADNILHRVLSTRDATMQIKQGEPDPSSCSMGGSVWYRFVAPATASFGFTAAAITEYQKTFAVYTGTSLSALTVIGSNCNGTGITFSATVGVTYWIQVGGYNGDSGQLNAYMYPI